MPAQAADTSRTRVFGFHPMFHNTNFSNNALGQPKVNQKSCKPRASSGSGRMKRANCFTNGSMSDKIVKLEFRND